MKQSAYSTANKLLNLKNDWDDQVPQSIKKKVASIYHPEQVEYNPFLDENGELVNKYINYQKVLDNPRTTQKAKEWITKATGLTQTTKSGIGENVSSDLQNGG